MKTYRIHYHDRMWGADGEHVGEFEDKASARLFAQQRDWAVYSITEVNG